MLHGTAGIILGFGLRHAHRARAHKQSKAAGHTRQLQRWCACAGGGAHAFGSCAWGRTTHQTGLQERLELGGSTLHPAGGKAAQASGQDRAQKFKRARVPSQPCSGMQQLGAMAAGALMALPQPGATRCSPERERSHRKRDTHRRSACGLAWGCQRMRTGTCKGAQRTQRSAGAKLADRPPGASQRCSCRCHRGCQTATAWPYDGAAGALGCGPRRKRISTCAERGARRTGGRRATRSTHLKRSAW